MEEEKMSQLSALLACRSRADLRRLRGMDSPSFSFITLACKHNRADLLKIFLKDNTPDCADVVVPRWCFEKYEGHDAVYYSIRSSNVELLRTLLRSVTPELSERLVSQSYEVLLLNNVLVSEEMHLFVQYKLVDLRFFSKSDGAPPVTSSTNILERIQLLVENIEDIKTNIEVDSHFLYKAKFIAQNIYILKHQLKSTYNILPWEEMEFCLVSFVSAHIRQQELNIFYLSVLRKDRLLKELTKFGAALQELEGYIESTDIRILSRSVVSSRGDIAASISSKFPQLYADYQEVRDASSLHIIKTYLNVALLADPATRLGQLTIKRALQVTGEHLKNTLDSPKLSPTVCNLLLLSAPKETRKVLQDLRNSLSHPHLLRDKRELELDDCIQYSNIQNDIKKIASVITDITYCNKLDKITSMLTMFITSDNLEEIQEIAYVFAHVYFVDVQEIDMVTKDHRKIEDIMSNIVDQTPYEKNLFAEIKEILDKQKIRRNLTLRDNSLLIAISDISKCKTTRNVISTAKSAAQKALVILSYEKNPTEINSSKLLGSLLSKFYDSVSTRLKLEVAIEIEFAIARIYYTGSFDKGNIKCIDEYSRQLLLDKINKNDIVGAECIVKSVKYNKVIIENQLILILTELENIIGTDRMYCQLYEQLSLLYKDVSVNRFMVEVLVLDTMCLLDSFKRIPNNLLYLDGNVPMLSGKCLRNHLAHGNSLVDILPTDAWSAVLLNAVKLTKSKGLLLHRKIGNTFDDDIKQLRRKYERGLCILNKQKEMWTSLRDGNYENFIMGIAEGADILSRKENLSSTLHYAARGPNIEIIKFLTKQNMISIEVRNIDGQTPLHVAANFGRDVTVEFLVAAMENAINQVDEARNTPLHLAAQNGHKKTVEILLSLGAKTTIKDVKGYSPLHYAVINNHLCVVKILLEKDATVDANTCLMGSTCLHKAAEFGHVEMVKYLLLNDADVNARNNLGIFPLHLAAAHGNLEIITALLENGAHVNLANHKGFTALHFAVENNHEEVVKILLEKGAFVNFRGKKYHNTPFHLAVYHGNKIIVGLLLEHKADVNARRKDGLTPLLLAASGGHAHIVDLLLQNDALDGGFGHVTGLTALHIAANYGHSSVVETLIQRGINNMNIHSQNTHQVTPLHLAAQEGHQKVVDILLAAGANVDSVNDVGSTALHISARNGFEVISMALIQKGANVNCKNNSYLTPLHEAASKICNKESLQMLLKYGAEVNAKGELCVTALHLASITGDNPMVETLLQRKADVDAEDNLGATALHLAVKGNKKSVVEILLNYGADINHLDTTGSSALCCAAKNNNKDLLDVLIAKGADVNVGGGQLILSAITAGHRNIVKTLLNNKDIDLNTTDQYGSNLLYKAAVSGDCLIARALITKGIEVIDCIPDRSSLLLAMSFGHTDFVNVLLESGANVNPLDSDSSPLFHAVLMNKPDIMERLLHWGANFNIRDSKNRTPLELAVANAQLPNTLILLQQAGVRINKRGNDNWTLLHFAARSGNLEVTRLLVDRGADENVRNIQGSKPIHVAARMGYPNILSFFLERGMSIDDRESAGCSLMHCAAVEEQPTVAQYLIDKGLDINSTNLNGFTPIHFSALQGHIEMTKLLLQSGAMYNARDKFGMTPSDLTKSREIKEILQSIGEIFRAVKKNDVLMVGILVQDLAKYVDVKSSENETLLHIASRKGFQEVCDMLLKSKANPNIIGKDGNASLHYASKFSHPGIVESLLKGGAAYNLITDDVKTPLDLAKDKDIKSLLQIVALCFRKVRVRKVNIIKYITNIKNIEIIRAVMKAKDTDGNTLVFVAIKCGFPNIDELKQVLQINIPEILFKVHLMLQHERFTEALDVLKYLLNDRIDILGEDNPGTLDIQYEIANVLSAQCKFSEVMPILEDIYKKRVEAFGPHHPDSLEIRSSLGILLHWLGRSKESWSILQDVMLRQKEVLGERHEQLMVTKKRAGVVLLVLNKHEMSLRLTTHVYKVYKKNLGAHHPETLILQDNIAKGLHAQGKPDEAFSLFQTVYEVRKLKFGPNHSDTLAVRCNMAIVLMSQHRLEEALEIFKEILDIQKNVFGLKHERTIHTQRIMTILYLQQNDMFNALKFPKPGLDERNPILEFSRSIFTNLDGHNRYLKSMDLDVGAFFPCDFNLIKAASEGDICKVCSLIENGSDVNSVDEVGRTALHFAGTVEVMELLLNSGADATAPSLSGNTPLHLATSRACEQRVRLLLQNVKKNKPRACYRKFINAKTVVEGSTALHVAAENGAEEIVSCLLKSGACYNIQDRSGNRTPLQCSSSSSVFRLLYLADEAFEMARCGGSVLPQGDKRHLEAALNSTDTEYRTPLMLATNHGHIGTARLLAGLLKTL